MHPFTFPETFQEMSEEPPARTRRGAAEIETSGGVTVTVAVYQALPLVALVQVSVYTIGDVGETMTKPPAGDADTVPTPWSMDALAALVHE